MKPVPAGEGDIDMSRDPPYDEPSVEFRAVSSGTGTSAAPFRSPSHRCAPSPFSCARPVALWTRGLRSALRTSGASVL
ncbi:hypothetical protein EYF80_031017 [Liparis tanakae]|uniref:Uncharacterized protein n=1 Tax=Liparis tanakae TaxID=230148 RepID=A0A4Z2H1K3_9TELE|nr:hypothetical protein EYF80_031017 [Liparis tanakae]